MQSLSRRETVPYTQQSRSERPVVLVSNRGPVEHYLDDDGRVRRRSAGGGVAVALSAVASAVDVTWVASASSDIDRTLAAEGESIALRGRSRLRFVAPGPSAYDLFYNTFSNPILWFVHHSLADRIDRCRFSERAEESWRRGYEPVNEAFAEAVVRETGPDDILMFQDYHLYLAPRLVREMRPRATLQHFVHVPWPRPTDWQVLPPRMVQAICRGLLANDTVVFQTDRSVHNFLWTCAAVLHDANVDFVRNVVSYAGGETRVWSNPISVDIPELHRQLLTPEARAADVEARESLRGRTIMRVDRLDPAKNVLGGFQAFEHLLEQRSEWRQSVSFLAFLVPTRTDIPEYQAYADEVFAAIDRINQRFGSADWKPVRVVYENNRTKALAAMRHYDVLLVNSIADGMNLVSKEGPVVNERAGVLVLSERAGSYEELRLGAIGVDPLDATATAEALHRALVMPASERRVRSHVLKDAISRHQISHWLQHQLSEASLISDSAMAEAVSAG